MKDVKCKYCGKVLKEVEQYEHDGKVMCEACLNSMTLVCAHCGERIWNI